MLHAPCLWVVALSCAAWLGCQAPAPGDTEPKHWDLGRLQLPADDAPHRCPLEWWYYSGHLAADTGERFGFLVAAFKIEDELGGRYYLGNFAVTDHETQRIFYAERPWLGDAEGDGYDLDIAGWTLRGGSGHDAVVMDAGDYAVNLRFESLKPPVGHGVGGQIGGGMADAFYYSHTRLEATGTLQRRGETLRVRGDAWMDHQWFNETIETGELAWDWFALQLDSDQELMVAISRNPNGPFAEATWVDADGTTVYLPADAFEVTVLGSWTSDVSGTTYPMGWQVNVPSLELELAVQPTLVDQELRDLEFTPAEYWEGEVDVTGTRASTAVTGQGYVELTGYASP